MCVEAGRKLTLTASMKAVCSFLVSVRHSLRWAGFVQVDEASWTTAPCAAAAMKAIERKLVARIVEKRGLKTVN